MDNNVTTDTLPQTWRIFWAKTDRDGKRGGPDWTRPLWAHLIDVANVAHTVWRNVLAPQTRTRLANSVHLSDVDAGRWYALLIGLHDLGKAIPCFQAMHTPSRAKLAQAGLSFKTSDYERDERVHHGHASIPILLEWLRERGSGFGWNDATIEGMAAFVGFHHGRIITRDQWDTRPGIVIGARRLRNHLGNDTWQSAQRALLDAVVNAWNPVIPQSIEGARRLWPEWLLAFAGYCTLSDWLGSMEEMFPDVGHADNVADYMGQSESGAIKTLNETGFQSRAALRLIAFGNVFQDRNGKPRMPRPLQTVMMEQLPTSCELDPTLTIVEAPTGEGKTEAALYMALRQQADGGPGIYVAMPSQATSNGLFGRFGSFLERTHDPAAGAVNLLLVHGMSTLDPRQDRLRQNFYDARRGLMPVFENDDVQLPESGNSRIETAAWFMPKKRSLLAPYGVGTVDQVLLAVLHAKHFALRHLGVAGKTVIFDEVHAYDTYMNTLFHRLLAWLHSHGASVIVLSATLPDTTRNEMIAAWTGTAERTAQTVSDEPAGRDAYHPYPAVWHITNSNAPKAGQPAALPVPILFDAALRQSAQLSYAAPDTDAIAESALKDAQNGAAVAVILNTVARAQEVFAAIREQQDGSQTCFDTVLFHARFPFELRSVIEARVLERFGPMRPSGVPVILIATQVAEQSLDIDVDRMYSDLAPIDLLLQRAGRLHRHEDHHGGRRPAGFGAPELTVLFPNADEGSLPDFSPISGRGHVYAHALMQRTWQRIRSLTGWELPDNYRMLIEGVYGANAQTVPSDLNMVSRETWMTNERLWNEARTIERQQALIRMIPEPQNLFSLVQQIDPRLAEEDSSTTETHAANLALTRLGGPSFDVVCLHEDSAGGLWLDEAFSEPLPSMCEDRRDTRRLIECSLKLSGDHMPAVAAFLVDNRWTQLVANNPALARHHVMIFRNQHWYADDGNHHYEYSTTLGIIRHSKRRTNNADL